MVSAKVTLRRVGVYPRRRQRIPRPQATADFAAIHVLAEVLGNTPSGRLYKALVETKSRSMSAPAAPAPRPGPHHLRGGPARANQWSRAGGVW